MPVVRFDGRVRAREDAGRVDGGMLTIAISTTTGEDGEYARAVRAAGAEVRLWRRFDADDFDGRLAGVAGVLLSGGGDVEPSRYGSSTDLASDIDPERDAFEIGLARWARDHQLPTLCICRGLQIANVAFGGSLVPDIATHYGSALGDLHRVKVDGVSERGLIAGHTVAIEADSQLATILGTSRLVTGSRHHQSLERVAADLRVVAKTPDGIVEAVEARFASPFWLGVQWHPESTVDHDDGASRAIFSAFTAAAARPRT